MNPIYDFNGQVALVTGASSAVGFATAQAFAEAGATVVLSSDSADSLTTATAQLAAAGHKVFAMPCDVADEAQVAALVAQTVAQFGRLDVAFNNAGIQGPHEAFTATSAEAYDAVININLRGVWACMKHELLQMEKQGSGAIVNCSSLGGLVGQAGRAAYHGTKHGVLGLTKSAGVESGHVCADLPVVAGRARLCRHAANRAGIVQQPGARRARCARGHETVVWHLFRQCRSRRHERASHAACPAQRQHCAA